MIKPEEVVSTDYVARVFAVDPKTVARWDKSGKFVCDFKTPGGHRRYRVSRLNSMMEVASSSETDLGSEDE